VTHKIDPQIDGERKYLEDSLTGTGLVSGLSYLRPTGAVEDARTATGEAFHSDGRVVVIALADNAKDRTQEFADVFCSVLEREHPDAGDWGPCGQYLDGAAERTGRALPPSAAWGKYRLLIVPGVFSACASGTPAFREGQAHLKDVHGMTVELLSVPNDSTENNARLIAQYLRNMVAKTIAGTSFWATARAHPTCSQPWFRIRMPRAPWPLSFRWRAR